MNTKNLTDLFNPFKLCKNNNYIVTLKHTKYIN